MLAQEPTQIVTDPRKYLTLVYGIAGVGKTEFGFQIPGHYFFYTEAGIDGVEIFGDPIFSWDGFIEKCNEIVTAKKAGWKDPEGNPVREITTIVIDTYEKLYALGAVWICANTTFPEKGVQQKFKRIEDVPYGKGYKRANELLIEKLNKLILLGFGVLVISHAKEKQVNWRGQDFSSYVVNLPPSAAQGIIDACGAVSFFNLELATGKDEGGNIIQREEGRYMYWQNTFLITAKHRLPGFPEKLPLPRNKGYETYLDAFNEAVERRRDGKSEDETGRTEEA